MWKRIIFWALALIYGLWPAALVLGAESVDITVTAQGIVSGGITSFTITYVSDTKLQLDWTYGANITGVMIRGKYGQFPADILTANETPSDGYLVYTGAGTSVNDTSMDFDTNPGPLYYRVWAQQADGSWVLTPAEDSKESAIMTLLAFFLLPGIVSFLCIRSSYSALKFCAGVAWWVAAFYWFNSPPSSIVVGSSVHTIMLTLLGAIGFVFVVMILWQTKRENGQETGRFRLPFSQTDEEVEQERAQERYRTSHSERVASHMAKVSSARRGEITRRG